MYLESGTGRSCDMVAARSVDEDWTILWVCRWVVKVERPVKSRVWENWLQIVHSKRSESSFGHIRIKMFAYSMNCEDSISLSSILF